MGRYRCRGLAAACQRRQVLMGRVAKLLVGHHARIFPRPRTAVSDLPNVAFELFVELQIHVRISHSGSGTEPAFGDVKSIIVWRC